MASVPPQAEKEIRNMEVGKYIRMDAFMEDEKDNCFLNTRGKDVENVSCELKWMLRYFEETTDEIAAESGSRRIQKMNRIVNEIKESVEFDRKIRVYMEELDRERRLAKAEAKAEARAEARAEAKAEIDRKTRAYMEELDKGKQLAMAEGRKSAHTEDAKRFKAKGVPLDIIAECTGLPLAMVEAI